MKILLFKMGAIGDVVMTTPLMRQLRNNFPEAKIDYLVGGIASNVMVGNKNINEIITFSERIFTKKQIFGWLKLIFQIRKRKYDSIFVLDKHRFFNFTAFLFRIKQRIGFDRVGKEGFLLTNKAYFDGTKHEIFYYLDLLKSAGLKADYKDFKTEIYLSKEDIKFADNYFSKNKIKRAICISPGGAKNPGQSISLKLWPKENYLELIKRLAEKNHQIILVGDKNDREIADFILTSFKNKKVFDLTGKTSIKQTAAIMKKCRAVVCNDTGPMHIATAVNEKVIGIFGPTDPKRFGPLNKKSRFVWKPSNCSPCNDIYGNFSKDCESQECMKNVTVEEVERIVK